MLGLRAATLVTLAAVFAGAGAAKGSTSRCALAPHTSTIHATRDNQVIELVRVDVSGSDPAISVAGFTGVTIRNVEVTFGPRSAGIRFSAADGLTIVNASVTLVGAATATGYVVTSLLGPRFTIPTPLS